MQVLQLQLPYPVEQHHAQRSSCLRVWMALAGEAQSVTTAFPQHLVGNPAMFPADVQLRLLSSKLHKVSRKLHTCLNIVVGGTADKGVTTTLWHSARTTVVYSICTSDTQQQ